jgi:beta-xylosidase
MQSSSRSALLALLLLGCGPGAEQPPDAGASDAGDWDAGVADAGQAPDAGAAVRDGGTSDAGAPDAGPPPIVNPVLKSDFPDPHVVRVGGLFHAWGTNIPMNGGRWNIPHAVSNNLSTWVLRDDALPVVGAWADGNDWTNWAPGVLVVSPTRTVLFYAAKRAGTGQQCIGRAVAANANGPFVDNFGAPLVCNTTSAAGFWSIDPSPFRDADGKLYLLWRQDFGSPVNNRAAIRQLAADGSAFAPGSAEVSLVSRTPGGWEDPVLENPAMVFAAGKHWLFYSANRWETAGYAVGYAECASVLGPCAKKTGSAPWLGTVFALAGPGGQDFFTDEAGQTWMSLHGWVAPDVGYPSGKRALWLYRFGIENGAPRLSAP